MLGQSDETVPFPTNPDSVGHLKTPSESASGLFLSRFDTPDEIDLFSAQVRRGLNCARRGLEGVSAVPAWLLVDARMRPGHATAARARRSAGLCYAGVRWSCFCVVGRLNRSPIAGMPAMPAARSRQM